MSWDRTRSGIPNPITDCVTIESPDVACVPLTILPAPDLTVDAVEVKRPDTGAPLLTVDALGGIRLFDSLGEQVVTITATGGIVVGATNINPTTGLQIK